MANIKKALDKLYRLEFSNPATALHKNKGEDGLTFMGIYQTANPKWVGWKIVEDELARVGGDLKAASVKLYRDTRMISLVEDVYKELYWDKAKLDKVDSQKIAEEIFVFGVNAGMRNAIRKAQKLVGATPDGIVGSQTLKALNAFNESEFDMKFDYLEIEFYEDLIKNKPSFAMFRNGWINRANAI